MVATASPPKKQNSGAAYAASVTLVYTPMPIYDAKYIHKRIIKLFT